MQRGTSGGGLSRYRSAPATWLEALLESDTEPELLPPISHTTSTTTTTTTTTTKPPPHPSSTHHHLPDLKPAGGTTRFSTDLALFESGANSNFVRQNSTPADFLSHISNDSYFSSYGLDYLSSHPINKRSRDDDSDTSPSKGEPSGKLQGSGGSMDAEMEKLMEDLVPCKVRAKRGCATHPRSIAERVRRTRISDRIRKLQELVPNMDKQTNTADMLDEAVEYVKFLQKQIQELTEHQKKCTCSMKDQ